MNGDDRDLRDAFIRLREAEGKTIPPFQVAHVRRPRPARLAFAFMALLVILAGAFIARRAQEQKRVPPPNVTLSTWRAPTDFLLQTPGRELLDSTPRLQPQTPVINISGGRT